MAPLELYQKPDEIDENLLYYAKNEERFWIDGWVADKKAHVTLLYGLLWNTGITDQHIRDVLGGCGLRKVIIDHVGCFASPYKDEDPYTCVVAHLQEDEVLKEAHARLSFLPHINTFPEYKAHMTLCYIKNDDWVTTNKTITMLNNNLAGRSLYVSGDIIISRKT